MNRNLFKITKFKLFLLLVLLVAPTLGIFFCFKRSTSHNSYPSIPSKTLDAQRQQIFTEIQNRLNTHHLNKNQLIQKLKEKHPTITELKTYLQTAKSIEELNTFHQEVKNAISYLTQSPPNPPTTLLGKIYHFLTTDQNNLDEDKIKNFAEKYSDPLEGINLAGMDKSVLLAKGSRTRQLKSAKGSLEKFKNWISLSSPDDGNCFLNSFSIHLIGDRSLATKLREALCLFLMKNMDYVESLPEKDIIESLIEKLATGNFALARNNTWLATDDVKYMPFILKRHVRVLYQSNIENFIKIYKGDETKAQKAKDELEKNTGGWLQFPDDIEDNYAYAYKDIWTVCHVRGTHFEPLISPSDDKVEPDEPFYKSFRTIKKGLEDFLKEDNGRINRIDHLEDGDFATNLASTDFTIAEYKEKLLEKTKQIFEMISITSQAAYNNANIRVKGLADKLMNVIKPHLTPSGYSWIW